MQRITFPGETSDIGIIEKDRTIVLSRTGNESCTLCQDLLMSCLSDVGIYPNNTTENTIKYRLKHARYKEAIAIIKTSDFYISD